MKIRRAKNNVADLVEQVRPNAIDDIAEFIKRTQYDVDIENTVLRRDDNDIRFTGPEISDTFARRESRLITCEETAPGVPTA
jgi:hypothetical protein